MLAQTHDSRTASINQRRITELRGNQENPPHDQESNREGESGLVTSTTSSRLILMEDIKENWAPTPPVLVNRISQLARTPWKPMLEASGTGIIET